MVVCTPNAPQGKQDTAPDNMLLYCDGKTPLCNLCIHQVCYGIVEVCVSVNIRSIYLVEYMLSLIPTVQHTPPFSSLFNFAPPPIPLPPTHYHSCLPKTRVFTASAVTRSTLRGRCVWSARYKFTIFALAATFSFLGKIYACPSPQLSSVTDKLSLNRRVPSPVDLRLQRWRPQKDTERQDGSAQR